MHVPSINLSSCDLTPRRLVTSRASSPHPPHVKSSISFGLFTKPRDLGKPKLEHGPGVALGSSLQSNGMRRGWEPGAGRAEAVRGNAAAFSSRAVQSGCRSTRPCPHPHPQPQSTLLQSSLGAGITQACSNTWGSAHDFCIPPMLPSVPLGSLPHAPLLLL